MYEITVKHMDPDCVSERTEIGSTNIITTRMTFMVLWFYCCHDTQAVTTHRLSHDTQTVTTHRLSHDTQTVGVAQCWNKGVTTFYDFGYKRRSFRASL